MEREGRLTAKYESQKTMIRTIATSDASRRTLLFGCALLAPALCLAQTKGPAVGTFGFDWLRPNSARCQPVAEPLLKRFRQCEYRSTGAFGLSDPVHVCRVDERSEYMVFATKTACDNNLETMKANAP